MLDKEKKAKEEGNRYKAKGFKASLQGPIPELVSILIC